MSNRITWIGAGDPPDNFPHVSSALSEPNGLLAAGGDLAPERLLWAYRNGIFPWYDEGQPLLWWSPDPRCVFAPGDFRVSRRLRRSMRQSDAEIRVNTAFADVIRACAGPRRHEQGTWITDDMIAAYEILHSRGWAHSVEVWQHERLVGGLYGIAIGKAFFGESMWSTAENASKFALAWLARQLVEGEIELLDCQVISQHLLSLGAGILPRPQFIDRLGQLCGSPRPIENWPNAPISVALAMPD